MKIEDPLTAVLAIARHTFMKLLVSRKAAITVLIAGFVAAVMGYAGSLDVDPLADGTDMLDVLILFFFMPVMAMIYGASLIRDEIDDRSITHIAVAPLDRAYAYMGYYLALALAVVVSIVVVNTAGFLAFFSQNGLDREALEIYAEFTALVVTGAVVYSSLFLCVGVIFKRPVYFGLFYAFVWEGFIGSLPGVIQKFSVKHYLRSIGAEWADQGSLGAFSGATDPTAAWVALAALAVVFIVLGAWTFRETELS